MLKITGSAAAVVLDVLPPMTAAAVEETKDAAVESSTGRRPCRLILLPVSLSSAAERVQTIDKNINMHVYGTNSSVARVWRWAQTVWGQKSPSGFQGHSPMRVSRTKPPPPKKKHKYTIHNLQLTNAPHVPTVNPQKTSNLY